MTDRLAMYLDWALYGEMALFQLGSTGKRLSAGGWFVVIALLAMLVAVIWMAVHIWNSVSAQMSGMGWGMLILGVIFSIVVGGGLMALVFYSNRNNYDR
ncbi:MAG: hypothetical protein JO056_13555 [Alphaproteobacteria bacterium]|nr:hypothetical protein [Alphaproteobacteria bacterium]